MATISKDRGDVGHEMFEKHGHDGTLIYGHHKEERRTKVKYSYDRRSDTNPTLSIGSRPKTFHQSCRRRVIFMTNILNLVEMHVGIASIEMSCLAGITGGAA
jgi:hypothetical protein